MKWVHKILLHINKLPLHQQMVSKFSYKHRPHDVAAALEILFPRLCFFLWDNVFVTVHWKCASSRYFSTTRETTRTKSFAEKKKLTQAEIQSKNKRESTVIVNVAH